MSRQTRTRLCANEKCDNVFECERSNARYCPECRKKRSYRRPPVVVELERVAA